ncbi:MAG: hypothetical protein JKY48_19740 [Flavobacteriales bacterium]|nr:hypothetical protein [Flavobacteriales bacterium]
MGSIPGVVMLSEVNPEGGGWGVLEADSYTSPWEQAKNWYGIQLKKQDYIGSGKELTSYCHQHQQSLIIRDWTHINFFKHPPTFKQPIEKLLNFEMISEELEVKAFAFVRDPIDVWISYGYPDADYFFGQINRYSKELKKHGIKTFAYEHFCENPELIIREICDYIDIEYSDHFKKFESNENVNGDIRHPKKKPSRGRLTTGISLLARIPIPDDKQKEMNNSSEFKKLNELK